MIKSIRDFYARANEWFGRNGIIFAFFMWFVVPIAVAGFIVHLFFELWWFWSGFRWAGVAMVVLIAWAFTGLGLASWEAWFHTRPNVAKISKRTDAIEKELPYLIETCDAVRAYYRAQWLKGEARQIEEIVTANAGFWPDMEMVAKTYPRRIGPNDPWRMVWEPRVQKWYQQVFTIEAIVQRCFGEECKLREHPNYSKNPDAKRAPHEEVVTDAAALYDYRRVYDQTQFFARAIVGIRERFELAVRIAEEGMLKLGPPKRR